MSTDSVTIDMALILAGQTERGGWNKSQLALIGVSWPPEKGWIRFVLGKEISGHDASEFVRLKTKQRKQNPLC